MTPGPRTRPRPSRVLAPLSSSSNAYIHVHAHAPHVHHHAVPAHLLAPLFVEQPRVMAGVVHARMKRSFERVGFERLLHRDHHRAARTTAVLALALVNFVTRRRTCRSRRESRGEVTTRKRLETNPAGVGDSIQEVGAPEARSAHARLKPYAHRGAARRAAQPTANECQDGERANRNEGRSAVRWCVGATHVAGKVCGHARQCRDRLLCVELETHQQMERQD